MKYLNLIVAATLTLSSAAVFADVGCEKDAEGQVTCQQVDGDSAAIDSTTTSQPSDRVPAASRSKTAEDQDGEAVPDGDASSTQAADPGITY